MVVSVGEAETVLFEQDASPAAAAAAATSGLRPTYLRLLRLVALAILIVGLVCCWRRRGRNKGSEYRAVTPMDSVQDEGHTGSKKAKKKRKGKRDQDEAEGENEFHFVVPPTRSGRALQDEEDDIEASAAQEVKVVEEAIKPSARQSRESRQVEAAPIMEVDEETTKAVTLAQLRALGLR